MKKRIFYCLIVASFFAYSQKEGTKADSLDLVWANYHYTNGNFKKAIARWQKNNISLPPQAINLMAKAYNQLGDTEKAQALLSQIIDTRHVAVEDYYLYANLVPNRPKLAEEYRAKAARLPLEKRMGSDTVQSQAQLDLINLKRNTPFSEFGGYFVPEKNQLGFYFLSPQKEAWTKKMRRRLISSSEVYNLHRAVLNKNLTLENEMVLPTNINSIFQEGPIAVDTIHKIIFLSRSSGKIDNNNKVQVDLYRYNYSKPNQIPVPLKINTAGYSTLHPAVDYANNRLIFASDRPGGHGGMDLYYIPLDQINQTPELINLGTDINTKNNETFPFVLSDGTLFYTNEASSRSGDFEVNMALKGPEDRWKNYLLKAPYNSNYDDFSFSISLDKGLGTLSSNRPGGQGNDDLYLFHFQPQIQALEDHYLFTPNDTLVIPFEGVLQNDLDYMVAKDPLVLLVEKKAMLKEKPHHGVLQLNANGSFFYKTTTKPAVKDSFSYMVQSPQKSAVAWVYLNPKEAPMTPEILETFRPIFYDLDKNNLKENYRDRVDAVVRVMNKYPQMEIEIISSTDCLGSAAYNLELSLRRTNTILKYVKARITNAERIQGTGVGEANLTNNTTKNYTLFAGQFEVFANAEVLQKSLKAQGVESRIRTRSSGLHAVAIQDFEYLFEAKKTKAALAQRGIQTSIVACDCYQLPEDVHQQQRKTIFKILNVGDQN